MVGPVPGGKGRVPTAKALAAPSAFPRCWQNFRPPAPPLVAPTGGVEKMLTYCQHHERTPHLHSRLPFPPFPLLRAYPSLLFPRGTACMYADFREKVRLQSRVAQRQQNLRKFKGEALGVSNRELA